MFNELGWNVRANSERKRHAGKRFDTGTSLTGFGTATDPLCRVPAKTTFSNQVQRTELVELLMAANRRPCTRSCPKGSPPDDK